MCCYVKGKKNWFHRPARVRARTNFQVVHRSAWHCDEFQPTESDQNADNAAQYLRKQAQQNVASTQWFRTQSSKSDVVRSDCKRAKQSKIIWQLPISPVQPFNRQFVSRVSVSSSTHNSHLTSSLICIAGYSESFALRHIRKSLQKRLQ